MMILTSFIYESIMIWTFFPRQDGAMTPLDQLITEYSVCKHQWIIPSYIDRDLNLNLIITVQEGQKLYSLWLFTTEAYDGRVLSGFRNLIASSKRLKLYPTFNAGRAWRLIFIREYDEVWFWLWTFVTTWPK